MAEPARNLDPYDPEGDNIRPSKPTSKSLSSVPTDGVQRDGDHWGRGKIKAVDGDGSKKLSPSELGDAEAAGADVAASKSGSQESSSINSNNQTFGYRNEGKKGKKSGRFSIRGLTHKKGLLLGVGAIGGVGVIIVLAVLFFSS